MEALAIAVATGVIQYLVEKTDLLESVRGWLKRDPASLAYQRALLRAYAAFARSDPALAKSFFDQTFLSRAAVAELAKQLTRHEHANRAELARLWAATLYADALAEQRAQWATNERVMNACANFLRWLENELKREQVFQPLFDSRALDALETKVDELTRALSAQRDEAMKRAEQYQPVVNQIARQSSVNISDSSNLVVYGDIIGGDKNVHNYFYGNFTSLDDYYIAPDSVYQRVKINEFVGREWLVSRIDAFLDDATRTSGVFRIEGEAGVGKTSFLAHLVRERGYLHLFAEQVPGDNNVERALLSLGAQIVSRYRLDPYADRNTLPAIAGGTDFLYKLLNLAAQRLTAGERIIVVCDALDEAGNGTNGNVFGLPTTLPDNVYFILSQRPVSVHLDVKCDQHLERVKPGDANNLQDMTEYLCGMARRPQIAQQLRARNYSDAEFVRVLTEKSGGVWMYLQYVLDEIQRGSRHPLELEQLPQGLVGYYLVYWGDWRAGRNHRGKGESEWYALYLPLLSTLAAAQEPVPLDTLIAWAGVNTTQYQVRNLLREQWRAFITEREEEGHAARFILYHASLRDFLTGKVDTNALSSADINFIDELRDGTRAAHQHIVADFTERCRGNWTDLIHDDYARRYLCLHLEGAEQYDKLAALVAWSDVWAKARYDKEENWSGYLTDLDRVWSFADRKENIGWQIRCALIESTIHSLAGNIFAELLAQLVETGLWSPARALAHIPQMPDGWRKAEALEKLAPLLPHELLGEALAAARGIQYEYFRANAVSGLATHLSVAQLEEALVMARGMQDNHSRVKALASLVPWLPESEKMQVVTEALAAVHDIRWVHSHTHALACLAPYLSDEEKVKTTGNALAVIFESLDDSNNVELLVTLVPHLSSEQLNDVLEAANGLDYEYHRVKILAALAPRLKNEAKEKVLSEALVLVRGLTDLNVKASGYGELAASLSFEKLLGVLAETLDCIRNLQDTHAKVDVLIELARQLPIDKQQKVLVEALAVSSRIQSRIDRIYSIENLVPHLPTKMVREVLALTSVMSDHQKVSILSRVASRLVGEERKDVLVQALAAVKEINDRQIVNITLGEVVLYLPSNKRDKILEEALIALSATIEEFEYELFEELSVLAKNLSIEERSTLLGKALTIVQGIQDETMKTHGLKTLLDFVTPESLGEFLTTIDSIRDEWSKATTLGALARYLPESDQTKVVQEVLEVIGKTTDRSLKAYGLIALGPLLKTELIMEALESARSIEDGFAKIHVFGDLLPYLPTDLLPETLQEVQVVEVETYRKTEVTLAIAMLLSEQERATIFEQTLKEIEKMGAEYNIARAYGAFVQHLTKEAQLYLLPQLFNLVTQSGEIPSHHRTPVWRDIIPVWQNLDFQGLEIEMWGQGLHRLARHPRRELVRDLCGLFPMILHLGGQDAVNEMFFAVDDVVRWWP